MNRKIAAGLVLAMIGALFLGAAGLALAGTVVTVTTPPATYSLSNAVGTPVAGAKGFKSLQECTDAAPVPALKYRCIPNPVIFDKVGTCDDVPKPEVKLVLDAQGFLMLPKLKVEAKPDGSWGPTMEEGYVKGTYPNCWVMGLVPYTGEWHAPDLPPTAETSPWIEGTDPEWPMGTPCPEAAHGNCYYSPNKPKAPPPGCSTPEFCEPLPS